jgi:excisionase family DNA binding protein
METYLTIEELAGYLKLAEQTIRRWILNWEIPFHKIKKVIRFRLSEIEKWIDNGGLELAAENGGNAGGGLLQGAVPPDEITETEQTEKEI